MECIQNYNKHRLVAIVSEQKRYDDAGGVRADGKPMSKRSDLVALSRTREAGEAVDGAGKCFGTIAGVHVAGPAIYHGGQGESLVPPHTRGSVSLSLLPDIARHVMGCHSTQDARVQNACG